MSGRSAPVEVRGLVFAGIESAQPAALARFFADVLGFDLREEDEAVHLDVPGGGALAVIPPGHMEPPSDTILGFLVDDVEAATAELAGRGVEVDGPLFTGPRFRWQHFRAPDGRVFELLDARV